MSIFKLLVSSSEPPNRQLKNEPPTIIGGVTGEPPNRQLKKAAFQACRSRGREPPNRQLKKKGLGVYMVSIGEPPNRQLILGLEASNGNDAHRRKAAMVLNPPRFLGGFFVVLGEGYL